MLSKLFFVEDSGEITSVENSSKDLQIELLKTLLEELPPDGVQAVVDDWCTQIRERLMPLASGKINVLNPEDKSDVVAFCTLLDVTVHQLRNFVYMKKKNQTIDK